MKKWIEIETKILSQNATIATECGQDFLARTLKNAAEFLSAAKNIEQKEKVHLINLCQIAVLQLYGSKTPIKDRK
jgi:hypothetical protein